MATPDPWDEWRKRRGQGFFGDPFPPEFEAEFQRMREEMNRFLQDALRQGFGALRGPVKPGGQARPGEPFVYGFSMRMGPDGKPSFQEFGNARQSLSPFAPTVEGAREPLVDVIVGEKEVSVTAELPGVEKKEINLHVGDDRVTLRVDGGRKYYKEIHLPVPVVPNTANATCTNGVLDVTITRRDPASYTGHKVEVH